MLYLKGIRLHDLHLEQYPGSIPAVKQIAENGLTFTKPVTFLAGENGTGKSTLLEAIAVAMGFNAEGGSRDFHFSTSDTHSSLSEAVTPIRMGRMEDGFFLRAESFYNTASYLDENSTLKRYGNQSLHEQSHGESFLSLVLHRFEGNGLYLLDEPEAALSPQRQLSLLVAIDRLVKQKSQFLIATHSPILLAYPNAEIKLLTEHGMETVAYRETEHYRVTKAFLENPERMLHYLLEENDG